MQLDFHDLLLFHDAQEDIASAIYID